MSYLVQNEVIAQLAAKDSVDVKVDGKTVSVPMGLKVTDKELQDRIKQIKQQVGGEKKLDKILKQQGVTMEALKAQLVAQMLQAKVQEKVVATVKVTTRRS